MTYDNFIQTVTDRIGSFLPEDTDTTLRQVIKNNDLLLDGLTIRVPGDPMSPTVYLNDFYPAYQQGEGIDAICETIASHLMDASLREGLDPSVFQDITRLRSCVVCRLISRERNPSFLKQVPWRPYLDLAVVYYLHLSASSETSASVLIRNSHIDKWKMTEEDLFALASEQTPRILPFDLLPLSKILQESAAETAVSPTTTEDGCPIYVLTNQSRSHGACALLYPDLLRPLSEQLSSDLFILPSSIHEVMLVPADPACEKDHERHRLDALVREVNTYQVAEEEVLSDHTYFYDRTTGSLC